MSYCFFVLALLTPLEEGFRHEDEAETKAKSTKALLTPLEEGFRQQDIILGGVVFDTGEALLTPLKEGFRHQKVEMFHSCIFYGPPYSFRRRI